MYCAYWCDLDLIQGQGQCRWPTEFPKIVLFYVYLLRYFGVALIRGHYDSMGPSLQLFGVILLNFSLSWRSRDFEVREMLISHYHQNQLRFISALPEDRSLWLWLQVGNNKPCMLAAMTVSPLAVFVVHSQVTIIFVVSVCLPVCLSVCLFVCAEFFSAVFDPISIKLGYMLYVWV